MLPNSLPSPFGDEAPEPFPNPARTGGWERSLTDPSPGRGLPGELLALPSPTPVPVPGGDKLRGGKGVSPGVSPVCVTGADTPGDGAEILGELILL